jgi:hypothetical protein
MQLEQQRSSIGCGSCRRRGAPAFAAVFLALGALPHHRYPAWRIVSRRCHHGSGSNHVGEADALADLADEMERQGISVVIVEEVAVDAGALMGPARGHDHDMVLVGAEVQV